MKAAAFIERGAISDPREGQGPPLQSIAETQVKFVGEGQAPPLQSIAGTQIMFVGAAACPARMQPRTCAGPAQAARLSRNPSGLPPGSSQV